MFKKKYILISFICIYIFVFISFSSDKQTVKTINAYYKEIKVILNGEEIMLKDANGNVVEPFIVDGTTYLPVRAISESLGLDVDWIQSESSVILSNKRKIGNTSGNIINSGLVASEDGIVYFIGKDLRIFKLTKENTHQQLHAVAQGFHLAAVAHPAVHGGSGKTRAFE